LWTTRTKLIIHADNARVHWAKKCEPLLGQKWVVRAPHPPYSPDLAPCDFFLFGYLKERLKGQRFKDRQTLEFRVRQIFTDIRPEIWASVFEEWLERLRWVIKHRGEYYRKTKD
jgi:histone-lysine N-methyltransferase SETMAR